MGSPHPDTSVSKKISHFEDDHYLAITGGTRFHADQTYLRVGMVQVTTGKSSKIP
jgi:hypothetical protein